MRAVKHRWIQINNDNLSSHFSDLTNMEESSLKASSIIDVLFLWVIVNNSGLVASVCPSLRCGVLGRFLSGHTEI